MIQAYVDDSGTRGEHPVFVMAGFIGEAGRWANFLECLGNASASVPLNPLPENGRGREAERPIQELEASPA